MEDLGDMVEPLPTVISIRLASKYDINVFYFYFSKYYKLILFNIIGEAISSTSKTKLSAQSKQL